MKKAFYWYEKSAQQGNHRAQCNLGIFYEFGIGTIQSYEKAIKWYSKSAEKGNAYAKEALERIRNNRK